MMILAFTSANVTAIILAVGASATALIVIGKQIGLLNDRTPSVEPRAEEMWRSEALAQKARADRLEQEMTSLRGEMDQMRKEIDILKKRPDLFEVIGKLDKIITAVVPPK